MPANEDAGLTLKSLRALLRSWHHPAGLGRHPLIRSRLVQARCAQTGEDEVAALRAVVQDAIARLRPTAPPSESAAPAWRGYLALTAHYLEGRALDTIAAEMGIATVSCRRALKEALAAELRRAEGAASAIIEDRPRWPVNTAPSVAGPLVGRAALLARLVELLSLGCRRMAVYGLPGVGKTRLLAQLANAPDVRAQFPDVGLWARRRGGPGRLGAGAGAKLA